VGLAHYTRENVMFHLGASFGRSSHRVLANAGVTFRLGDKNKKDAIPERYKAGPISATYVLQDEVTALKAENEKLRGDIGALEDKNDKLQESNEELRAGYEEIKSGYEKLQKQVEELMKQKK
ncbi:MAG: hypothetical protein IJM42_03300, partial [Synergistes sp.]|nr:hypothetical protein [Synergistes sp.]